MALPRARGRNALAVGSRLRPSRGFLRNRDRRRTGYSRHDVHAHTVCRLDLPGPDRPRSCFPGLFARAGAAGGGAGSGTDGDRKPLLASGARDLSRPVFDTKTPVYDQVTRLDKAPAPSSPRSKAAPFIRQCRRRDCEPSPQPETNCRSMRCFRASWTNWSNSRAWSCHAQQQGADEDPAIRRKVREQRTRPWPMSISAANSREDHRGGIARPLQS